MRQIYRLAVIGLALIAAPAGAQEIVAAAPVDRAIAAGDVAAVAVAQINDKADAAEAQQKVDLYKQLMELNGVTQNIRNVIAATKTATRLVIIDRAGVDKLTPEQDARYNQIADNVLSATQAELIDSVASAQAQNFTTDEIHQLITANASPAAAKYNAVKFLTPDDNATAVQNYMVDAVIKIIKTYSQAQTG
jgi:hypothetical protein